MNVILQGRIV